MKPRTRTGQSNGDGGFSLVEVIVAMSIVVTVVLATAPFFYKAIQREHGQGLRQTAVTIAGQRLDSIRALGPATLLTGRTASSVSALTATPGLVDLSQDLLTGSGADANYDINAVAGAQPVVPTITAEQVNKTTFTVRTYVDPCYRLTATSTCTSSSLGGVRLLRVSVDVSWPRGPGETCASGRPNQCEFVTSSMVDSNVIDPTFSLDVSQPTVTSMTPVTPTPVTVHPGQVVSVTMMGNNFVYGGIMTSDDPSDSFAGVSGNNGSAATANLTAGTPGQRLLRFQNPDGGNGGSAPTTSFTVTQSAPAITNVSVPLAAFAGTAVPVTISGSDFYSTVNAANAPIPPSVIIAETNASGTTTLATSNVSPTGTTTLNAFVTLSPVKGAFTLTATVLNADAGTATRTSTSGIAL